MALIAQVIVYGLITGCLYALLGMGWNFIYHTTRTFHFAHGTVFVAAAYTVVLATMSAGLPLLVGGVLAVIVAVALGCGIEYFIYRPLRSLGATLFVIFIAAIGVFTLGENLIIVLFSATFRRLEGFPIIPISLGPVTFTTLHVLTATLSLATLLGLYIFLTASRAGKAMRAVACNPLMSEAVGISKQRVFVLSFGLGSACAAIAAVLWALDKGVIPTMGTQPLFAGFIVSIIGGIGSFPGALAAGLILGLAENLSLLVLSPDMTNIVSFVVLIIVLIVKPTGLFASEVKKLI